MTDYKKDALWGQLFFEKVKVVPYSTKALGLESSFTSKQSALRWQRHKPNGRLLLAVLYTASLPFSFSQYQSK